jgi:hypothetical protein
MPCSAALALLIEQSTMILRSRVQVQPLLALDGNDKKVSYVPCSAVLALLIEQSVNDPEGKGSSQTTTKTGVVRCIIKRTKVMAQFNEDFVTTQNYIYPCWLIFY